MFKGKVQRPRRGLRLRLQVQEEQQGRADRPQGDDPAGQVKQGKFSVKATYFDYPTFWLNSPGTYYWQAHRINCGENQRLQPGGPGREVQGEVSLRGAGAPRRRPRPQPAPGAIAQTALAAGVAWELATLVQPRPYFAPDRGRHLARRRHRPAPAPRGRAGLRRRRRHPRRRPAHQPDRPRRRSPIVAVVALAMAAALLFGAGQILVNQAAVSGVLLATLGTPAAQLLVHALLLRADRRRRWRSSSARSCSRATR